MSDSSTIDLFDGWRATFDPSADWLCVRLHPPGGPGQFDLALGLWNEIQRRGESAIILELDEIAFLPSALMSEIVRLHKRIAMAGGRMRLCGLQEHPREAVHLMRLDELVTIYPDRLAASA